MAAASKLTNAVGTGWIPAFTISVVWMKGQIMNQYFRYFGIMDKLSIKRMDEEVFDRIYYKDAIYDYAMGYERFMETLCCSFPHERGNLKKYVASIRSVGNLISIDT